MMRYLFLLPLVVACAAHPSYALNAEMDPVPVVPVPAGGRQAFLVTLSNAKSACEGTVAFEQLGEGLRAEPASQPFKLAPGESKTLAFTIANSSWGDAVAVRPKIETKGGEAVQFPELFTTEIIRDAKLMDKKPLDDQGLLLYYSCGDGMPYNHGSTHTDQAAGFSLMWIEGVWVAPGGVKGNCVRGRNGDVMSKAAFDPLVNTDHGAGTILFWMRKENRETEIAYSQPDKIGYDETWKLGPVIKAGWGGEGLVGINRFAQSVISKRVKKGWKERDASNTGVGLRRYIPKDGKPGYLEASYQGLRERIYSARAPYDWTPEWRHVAMLWDTGERRLEIYLDGELASDAVRTNGTAEGDEAWYGAPFSCGTRDQAQFCIILPEPEGGKNATRRDELYVYNRALNKEEIQANRKAAMGAVVAPAIEPPGGEFYGTHKVIVRSLWSNPVHRYTLDGSEPTEASPEYSQALSFEKDGVLKVKSFLAGFEPSATATATFTSRGPDKRPPAVREVIAYEAGQVLVVFDKDVARADAENAGHYTLRGEAKVVSAALGACQRTVHLKLDKPLGSGEHALSIEKICDTTPSANDMAPLKDKAFAVAHLPGLVGWWSFDVLDGAVLKDLGPLGVDGTAFRDVDLPCAQRVEGRRGRALEFSANGDWADLTHYTKQIESTNMEDKHPLVKRDSPMSGERGSLFLWLKVAQGKGGCVVSKQYAYTLGVNRRSGGWNASLFGGAKMESKVSVADGQWHQVGMTFTNTENQGAILYVDGAPAGQATMKARGHAGNRLELSIPRGWAGTDAHLDGCLDEVMFFDRVLTPEEVQSLFTTGSLKP